jgi:sugar lactone lactonase YvrE
MKRRLILFLGLIMALSLVIAPAASADGKKHHPAPLPTRIDLPDGFQPEGITSGLSSRWAGSTKLYVGSLADGAIWRGSARTGKGKVLVAGIAGQSALGLHIDWRGRLWVAGGANKTIRVYNSKSGTLLRTYTFPTAGFLNDLVITRSGVYATDSLVKQLAVVPFSRWSTHSRHKWGKLPATDKAKVLPLGDGITYLDGFNANGIVAKGGWLILVQSNTGQLFRVNPRTGVARAIVTDGDPVTNGDGLVLRGRWLYVVRNQNNLVAVLKLGHGLKTASFVGHAITAPGLDFPTTATFAAGKLWAVNARFSTPPTATTEYWITKLKVKP